jgi:hypothetical protein
MAPFYASTQDRHFSIDESGPTFPSLNPVILYIIDYFMAPRHKALWRFSPSDMYGQTRRLALPNEEEAEPALVGLVRFDLGKNMKAYLVVISLLSAYLAKKWVG